MPSAANILVPQQARVWLSPVGTSAPADPVIAPAAAWKDVGYFTPDSLGWSTDPTFEEVRSHQSSYPTRRFQTEDSASLEVDLQEWTVDAFKAVYGGGTFADVPGPPPHFKFTPPAIGGRTETAVIIEIIDGTKHWRRIIPRAFQVEGVEQSFSKTAESTLPLRLAVLGSDSADPFYDISDIPGLDPAP
jgi:hypothetical protein